MRWAYEREEHTAHPTVDAIVCVGVGQPRVLFQVAWVEAAHVVRHAALVLGQLDIFGESRGIGGLIELNASDDKHGTPLLGGEAAATRAISK